MLYGVSYKPQQPSTGLLGGNYRNALIDALVDPKPKLSDIQRSDTVTKTIADLLAGSYDPFKKY